MERLFCVRTQPFQPAVVMAFDGQRSGYVPPHLRQNGGGAGFPAAFGGQPAFGGPPPAMNGAPGAGFNRGYGGAGVFGGGRRYDNRAPAPRGGAWGGADEGNPFELDAARKQGK